MTGFVICHQRKGGEAGGVLKGPEFGSFLFPIRRSPFEERKERLQLPFAMLGSAPAAVVRGKWCGSIVSINF